MEPTVVYTQLRRQGREASALSDSTLVCPFANVRKRMQYSSFEGEYPWNDVRLCSESSDHVVLKINA